MHSLAPELSLKLLPPRWHVHSGTHITYYYITTCNGKRIKYFLLFLRKARWKKIIFLDTVTLYNSLYGREREEKRP